MILRDRILDHIHDRPFIQFGVETLRIPGVAEGQCRRSLALFFRLLEKIRVNVFADRFFPLEGFLEVGVRILHDQVFDQIHLPGGMYPLRIGDGPEQQGDLGNVLLVCLFRVCQQPEVGLCLTDKGLVDVVFGLFLHQRLHNLK